MADTQGFFFPDNTPEQAQLLRQQLFAKQLIDGGQSDQATGAYGGLANAGKMLAGALLSKRLGDKAKDLETTREGSYSKALGNFLSPFDYGGAPNADTGVPDNVNVSPQASADNAGRLGSSMGARLAATGNQDLIRQAAPQLMAQQLQANQPITPYQQTEIDARKAEQARQAALDARPVFRQPGEIPIDPNTGAPKIGPDGQPLPATGGAIRHLTPDEIQQWGYQPGTQGYSRGDGLPPTITYKPPVPEGPKSADRRAQDNEDALKRDQYRINAQLQSQSGAPGAPLPGLTGKPEVDPTAEGYGSKPVGNTGLTQAALDQKALSYITSGTQPPVGRSGTIAGIQSAAISNRMAEMDPGGNLAGNKVQLKALSSALSDQVTKGANVERSVAAAEKGFKQVVDTFQGKVNDATMPIVNAMTNAARYQFSPGDVSAFKAGLQEVANEYTQVFSRGGQATDQVRSTSAKIANGDLSISDLGKVLKELQAQGGIVSQEYKNQAAKITGQIWHPGQQQTQTAPGQAPPGGASGKAPVDFKDYFGKP